MILNQELSFDQLPESIRVSFNSRTAKHELIPANTLLYKFADGDLTFIDNNDNREKASPFWGTMDDLFDIMAYAKSTNKQLADCVRLRNAVLHGWNGLTSLRIIKLSKPIYGFTGNIGPQNQRGYAKRHYTSPVFFGGGASQVVLPNLLSEYIIEIVPKNTVLISDGLDEIEEFLKDLVV